MFFPSRMVSRAGRAGLLLTFALAGCGPEREQPDFALPPTPARFAARTSGPTQPVGRWPKQFGSAELARLLEQAEAGFTPIVPRELMTARVRGVGTVGDSYGQAFDDFAASRLDLRRAETVEEAFDLVSSGQADYMVYSLYAGKDFLKKAAATARFETLPKFISEENFYIVVSKRSRYVGLLPRINAEIARRITGQPIARASTSDEELPIIAISAAANRAWSGASTIWWCRCGTR